MKLEIIQGHQERNWRDDKHNEKNTYSVIPFPIDPDRMVLLPKSGQPAGKGINLTFLTQPTTLYTEPQSCQFIKRHPCPSYLGCLSYKPTQGVTCLYIRMPGMI